jgi:uncharacterized protein YbjT (DUF2867 family)
MIAGGESIALGTGLSQTILGFHCRKPGLSSAATMAGARPRNVFVTGGTGYLGRFLIPELLARGHSVTALVRPGSEKRLPEGARPITGDALDHVSFRERIAPADTFVQLVGVHHPGPAKAAQFRTIDLVSVTESVKAAVPAGIQHFVYLSVATPAPVMDAYQAVRLEGESMIRRSGMNATFIRPLYVLGPGHCWPYAILPIFWLVALIPSKRKSTLRLMPVTLRQTIRTLVQAVEHPPTGIRIIEAGEIRSVPMTKPPGGRKP